MEYKAGDRVTVINRDEIDDAPRKVVNGLHATVIGVDSRDKDEQSLLVEFDEDIQGHGGNGIVDGVSGKRGHCWWMNGDGLELLPTAPPTPDVPLGAWEAKL